MDTFALLLEVLAPQPGERILDVGCGMGGSTARLAAAGARVTGIDALPALLEQARLAYPACEFVEANLLHYRPAEPFDAVFAHATLHWVHPPREAAGKVFDCLKPGGRFAASLGGAVESARELEAYFRPAPKEYTKLLRRVGFAEVEVELLRPEVNGGTLIASARRPL